MNEFLVSGRRLMKRDKDSADWKRFIRAVESFISEWAKAGGNKDANRRAQNE